MTDEQKVPVAGWTGDQSTAWDDHQVAVSQQPWVGQYTLTDDDLDLITEGNKKPEEWSTSTDSSWDHHDDWTLDETFDPDHTDNQKQETPSVTIPQTEETASLQPEVPSVPDIDLWSFAAPESTLTMPSLDTPEIPQPQEESQEESQEITLPEITPVPEVSEEKVSESEPASLSGSWSALLTSYTLVKDLVSNVFDLSHTDLEDTYSVLGSRTTDGRVDYEFAMHDHEFSVVKHEIGANEELHDARELHFHRDSSSGLLQVHLDDVLVYEEGEWVTADYSSAQHVVTDKLNKFTMLLEEEKKKLEQSVAEERKQKEMMTGLRDF